MCRLDFPRSSRARLLWPLPAILVILTLAPIAGSAEKSVSKTKDAKSPDAAIRAAGDAFVKAFNAGDAKAIGALWAPDAEYTDESGQSIHGRAAIEKEYADLFKEHPGATMTVTVESIRFFGPDTAVEKGIAKVKSPEGDAGTGARYTVVHAKRDGTWTMVVGRDDRHVPESNEEYLKGLQWLAWTVGDNKTTVGETGIYNLTKDESPALIHIGKDKTQQWTLVRMKQPDAQGQQPGTDASAK